MNANLKCPYLTPLPAMLAFERSLDRMVMITSGERKMKSNSVAKCFLTASAVIGLGGCTAKNVNFAEVKRPERAAQMDAFTVFVGSWTWKAQVENATGSDKDWSGTATWDWSLDKRCLQGRMSSKTANADFESSGVWSWHPKSKKYVWWMFNNWGYPQQGTAKYNAENQSWVMNYTSVGLDGSTSHGRYRMKVVDQDTLDWTMEEWADPLHLIKKVKMVGTYHRKK